MIIELNKATLSVGKRQLFTDVSFMARPGDRVAITGTDGHNLTYIMQALLGMRSLDSGNVCVDGEPVLSRAAAFFRKSMSFVPQLISFGNMTVEDIAHEMCDERTNKAFAYSPDTLAQFLDQMSVDRCMMSRGFSMIEAALAQRAVIAVTSMFRHPIALFDNPTSMQDEEGSGIVAKFLSSGYFDDVSMVVATNDPQLTGICNKTIDISAF